MVRCEKCRKEYEPYRAMEGIVMPFRTDSTSLSLCRACFDDVVALGVMAIKDAVAKSQPKKAPRKKPKKQS